MPARAPIPADRDAVLAVRSLVKRYGRFEAVRGIDLSVPAGSIYGLLGPNGSGKTTTMACALGLLRPTSGSVELLGRPAARIHELRGRVAALFDDPTLVRTLTVRQNLEYARRLGGGAKRPSAGRGVDAALEKYAELREEHYGRGRYDFGSGPLNSVAEKLAREKSDVDGGIAVMQANLEYNPDEAYPHILLGQLYASKGDHDKAIAELERSLEIEPDNRWAKRQLQQVKQAKAGGD